MTLGTRWILVPVAGVLAAGAPTTNGTANMGSVLALRLIDGPGGTVSLESGWRSHGLRSPATPIIVNGVVFALSTGRPPAPGVGGNTAPGGRGNAAQDSGMPAVLYAYHGASGAPLWISQKSMTTSASPRSFWSAMGQVYVGADDGTIYAFGFLDERR
jgi:hypothetical protein